MKEFDPPLVAISQEEYQQLITCKSIAEDLWRMYGAYSFPKEMREPSPMISKGTYHDSIYYRLTKLMDFDDSE